MTNQKLKMKWDKKAKDFIVIHPNKRDGNFLFWMFTRKRVSSTNKIVDSFLDELDKRGYDLSTLKFEIKLKD